MGLRPDAPPRPALRLLLRLPDRLQLSHAGGAAEIVGEEIDLVLLGFDFPGTSQGVVVSSHHHHHALEGVVGIGVGAGSNSYFLNTDNLY